MSKSKWLQEVEDDATRITQRRFDAYFDEQQYQKAKVEQASTPVAKVEEPVKVEEPEALVVEAKVNKKKGDK